MFETDSPSTFLVTGLVAISAVVMFAEFFANLVLRRHRYGFRDSLANLSMYAGFTLVNIAWLPIVWLMFFHLQEHAVWSPTLGVWHLGGQGRYWEWILLIVVEDFCFYWFHRFSHRSRLLWASHVTHHSSQNFNLTVAFRQTWVPFFGVMFWLPLPLLFGFDPLMILTVQTLSLFYQDLLHTQFLPRLGPLEWIFNTPTHHQVHHGSNGQYIDKNYGGVLIIWDRLFGTFAKKEESVRYGLTKNLTSHNPLTIAFHEWGAMLQDVTTFRGLRGKMTAIFGPPEKVEQVRGTMPKAHADA